MSFVPNSNQQITLNDSMFQLTARERKFLDKSWAKVFAEKIFPAIREEDFAVLYSSKISRPNTPVNVIVGALILKEALGVTDDELVEALMFDIRYQYALHTTSFEEQPLSDRTLSRFRARCLSYETETGIDLIHMCITGLAKEISEFMGISPNMQRMDSIMVAANIRKLSQLELFYTCVSNLAKVMVSRGLCLPEHLKHYTEKDDMNRIVYHERKQDMGKRISTVISDSEELLASCDGGFDDTSEYQLLIRLLKEQTIFDDGNGKRRLREKKERENPSMHLRNPADPEATFRIKGEEHIGYVGNIVETVGECGSVVTDYAYEQNTYSDAQFMRDYLSGQTEPEETVTIVTDGAYGGSENIRNASLKGFRLIPTNFTTSIPESVFADFVFNEEGTELLTCANGKKPVDINYTGGKYLCTAKFELNDCINCPYCSTCNPKLQKRFASKTLSWKTVDRAKMGLFMQTEEFVELAHFRNGVEAIPSLLRRKYNVDRIPAHGKRQSKLHFGFKIGAINFKKLLDYYSSQEKCAFKKKVA